MPSAPRAYSLIDQVEGCKLTAVCDVREVAANDAAERYGASPFTDVLAMIESGEIDAVTIATPSGFHLESVLSALGHDIPALVEKPLEITVERIDSIIEAESKSNGFVAGVYQSRFRPLVRKMKTLIDSGLIGEIYTGSVYIKRYRTQEYFDSGGWRGTWEVDGGGCLMNQGIHDLDLYQWFMGNPLTVTAITETKGRDVEVETLALALVRFDSGVSGVIEATTLAYPEYRPFIEIVGSRGTVAFSHSRLIRMDIMDPTGEELVAREELLEITKADEHKMAARAKARAGTAVPSVDMGHTPVVSDFVESIRTGRPPYVTAAKAREAVALISAVYASGRAQSKPVRVP